MVQLLRRHYLPDETKPAGIFAPEIQAPGPTQRRADLIWLGCTAATGPSLVGHEIKVSRADLLTELADLTKSDPWQRYCDRWWLVLPHTGLLKDLDIPETWGVMTPPSGRRTRSMTIHRPATKLNPVEQAPALRTLAAWLHWKLRDSRAAADEANRRREQVEKANQQLRYELPSHNSNPAAVIVGKILAGLGGSAYGDEIGEWPARVQVQDVIDALRDLGTIRHYRDNAQRDLNTARRELQSAQAIVTTAIQQIDKQRKELTEGSA